MATFAQFERKLIGQRTKDALAVKRQQGVRLGRPPTLSAEIVRTMKKMRSRGASYRAIAETLDAQGVPAAQGGKRWYPATVRKVLAAQRQVPRLST
jgi:DNA invertase Pin-like site-specific DNA recombinase